MATFTDLKSKAGLKEVDTYLLANSYIGGYTPSDLDVVVSCGIGSAPSDKEFPHLVRWFKHIQSFTPEERKKWEAGPAVTNGTTAGAKGEEDEDIDLFGSSDEDDEEKERIKEERLAAYAAKKSKKPGPIAKSSILFDVKPWDDTCDLDEVEKHCRSIACDGLLWGQVAKKVPVAFGIFKLQIGCVVEDDKVSTDFLEEQIMSLEDLVQSVDIAAFNKI